MTRVSSKLRRAVVRRARERCEYCGLFQAGQEAAFHIDHVQPVADGGLTRLDNLAIACVSCSLRKGARRTGIDPQTGSVASLFSPREHSWQDHFRWEGMQIMGLSATGRATVSALDLNRPSILEIREEERTRGRSPSIVD